MNMPPTDVTDAQLLDRFLAESEPESLRPLVLRYQDVVYASAMRQLRRADLAEDVTQAVFLVLAKKAKTLQGRATIGGWLMKVTRYAAIDAMRKQTRQRRHERAAAKSEAAASTQHAAAEWEALSRVLDESLAQLRPAERDSVVMRFFQDLSFAQIGMAFGISEEAARKRVARSVMRLKTMVDARGVGMPAIAIGPMLLQHGSATAPASVVSALAAPATSQSALLAKGVIKMIAWTNAKLVTGVATVAILAVGGGVVVQQIGRGPASSESSRVVHPVVAQAVADQSPATLDGAAALYDRAAKLIVIDCPAASVMEYPSYPPFGDAWTRLAAEADLKNKPARDLVRQGRAFNEAHWPLDDKYLNGARALANETGDSALYLHLVHGRDAEAIESIRDVMHLADLLRGKQDGHGMIRWTVATGVEALAFSRLLTIAPGLTLAEKSDGRTVAISDLRKLIADLLTYASADAMIADAMLAEPNVQNQPIAEQLATAPILKASIARATIAVNRVNAERAMSAMSLACQVYRFEKGQWPATLEDLVPAYLPQVPVDPFGDGKQTLGYVLIKAGLPDGKDRPLVYGRAESRDGMFYRLDAPQYAWYVGDGTDRPVAEQRRGGQFRDVSRWTPGPRDPGAPTTADLP